EAGEQMQRVDGSNHVEENAKGVLWRKKPCLRKLRPSDELANQKQQPQKERGKHKVQELNLLVAPNCDQAFLQSETADEQNGGAENHRGRRMENVIRALVVADHVEHDKRAEKHRYGAARQPHAQFVGWTRF